MTGVKDYLMNIKPQSNTFVIFSDGGKGELKGIGKPTCSELSVLEDVSFVEGRTVNLINISQLCDKGLKVKFTKSKYVIINESMEVLMKGIRSKNNCYIWTPKDAVCASVTKQGKCRTGNKEPKCKINLEDDVETSVKTSDITTSTNEYEFNGNNKALNAQIDINWNTEWEGYPKFRAICKRENKHILWFGKKHFADTSLNDENMDVKSVTDYDVKP